MKNFSTLIAVVFISCFSINSWGQKKTHYTSVDSLKSLIRNGNPDTNKINNLYKLANIYSYKLGYPDTAVYYSDSALKLARQIKSEKVIAFAYYNLGHQQYNAGNRKGALGSYLTSKKMFEGLGDKRNIFNALRGLGRVYDDEGNAPEALKCFFEALNLTNDKDITSAIYNDIAAVYESQDNYVEVLKYTLKSLKLQEQLGNKKKIASLYNNLGTIYSYQNKPDSALKSYNASLKIREEIGDRKGMATCHNNIGLIEHERGNYEGALNNYFLALKFAEGTNYLVLADASNNIGTIYILQKKYSEALKYISTALSIHEETGYKYGMANSLITLSELHLKLNSLKEARSYLNKALAYGSDIGSIRNIESSYKGLVQIDSIQGNWKSAFEHHKLYIQYRDQINNEESDKKITEILLTNRFQQQEEKLKAENEKQQALAQAENRRQTVISWSIGGGLFLVIVFAGFVLRSLRITNKQKAIIEAQKDEVTKQKDIAEELRLISEKQKHIVEEKQKEIVDSITYAKRIQTALLTSDEYIRNNFEAEHFILFKPKDIVSGDFYWALSHSFIPGWDLGITNVKLPAVERRKNLFYIATADCTGHGVPGAFMSMLNISFLNENIIERGILQPHEILNAQRKEIIKALNPEGSKSESKDGMDCILCVYDFNKMLLHFAAANNPLWLIRNNELIEFAADKMPVGKFNENNKPFTLQTVELQKGDVIYTSTDGFADQFGENGKKLIKKRFKEELLGIHQLTIREQKDHLNNFFEKWKGSQEQVDDVCVIGVRV